MRLFASMIVCMVLAGCWVSDKKLVRNSPGQSPFPSSFVTVGLEQYEFNFEKIIEFDALITSFREQSDGTYTFSEKSGISILFDSVWLEQVPNRPDHWLAQFQMVGGVGFSLQVLQVNDDSVTLSSYDLKTSFELANGLDMTLEASGLSPSISFTNRASLFEFTERVLSSDLEPKEKTSFKIFDTTTSAGRAEYKEWRMQGLAKFEVIQSKRQVEKESAAAQAKAEREAKALARQKAKEEREARARAKAEREARAAREREEAKAAFGGNWALAGDDIMGDGAKQIVGAPTKYSGSGQGPIIRFSCIRGRTQFDIVWPSPLAAFHKDESGFVYVRFELKRGDGPIRTFVGVPSESRQQLFEMNAGLKAIAAIEFGLVGIFQPAKKNVNLSWTASSLGRSWASANTIAIRGKALNGQDMTAAYGMSGFTEAWNEFSKSCR